MTGKGKKKLAPINNDKAKRQAPSPQGKKAPSKRQADYKPYIALFTILVISFITYIPVLHAGFINWDDNIYIEHNPLIYTLNMKALFSTNIAGNYHPLTMLAYALEYHFFGLSEKGFHAVNLALHFLNVILVFFAIKHLSANNVVAIVATLLFGVHPIHVESVAWASELKDLLYTFFFLSSYVCYLLFIKSSQKKFYVFALILFMLSVLAKAMAVSLPALFLLTDYFMKRKMNLNIWLEKIPFAVIGIAFGVIAVYAQKSTGAIGDLEVFPFYQRAVYACYGFLTYLQKLIFPHPLSAYYPYPVRSGEPLPAIYYIYPVLLLAFAALIYYSARYSGKIIFGIGFFTITVFLVLQLLPVGATIISDRYTYIPSIGIFYLAAEGFHWLWKRKALKLIAPIALGLFTIFFSIKTYARCEVWKSSLTLWNDVISQYKTIAPAYNNRAILLQQDNKYEEALADLNKAIELQSDYALAYNDRGLVFSKLKKNEQAYNDFNKAIQLQPVFPEAYTNRGIVLSGINRLDDALRDFNTALEQKPDYAETYYYRGFLYATQNKFEEAVRDYGMLITLQPNHAEGYYDKAISEYKLGKNKEACEDLHHALDLGWQFAANAIRDLCH